MISAAPAKAPGSGGRRHQRAAPPDPFLEVGEGRWTVDEIVRYDVPAVLEYVKAATGSDRVNWVGHSLGGMLMFPYLELSPEPWPRGEPRRRWARRSRSTRPRNPTCFGPTGASESSRRFVSPGRLGRPLMFARFPGLDRIDQFYYTSVNVDKTTVSRFYGYTLEDTGRSALKQLDPYLEFGHFVSADRRIDYPARLGEVTVPTLMIAGDGDVMSDVPSTELTFQALGSPDKHLMRFGKAEGHYADYGHCDLVWSRYAPNEIFPALIDWLDARQPGTSSPQRPSRARDRDRDRVEETAGKRPLAAGTTCRLSTLGRSGTWRTRRRWTQSDNTSPGGGCLRRRRSKRKPHRQQLRRPAVAQLVKLAEIPRNSSTNKIVPICREK